MKTAEIKQLINTMLDRQEEQTKTRNIAIFQRNPGADRYSGGFDWDDTPEGFRWWADKIRWAKGYRKSVKNLIDKCPREGFDLSPKPKTLVIDKQKYVI